MKKTELNCVEMVRKIRDQMFLENLTKTDTEKIRSITEAARSFEAGKKRGRPGKRAKAA